MEVKQNERLEEGGKWQETVKQIHVKLDRRVKENKKTRK